MPALPLAVPMNVDALVVNQAVLARDTFRWWPFDYTQLTEWRSPEPAPTSGSVGGAQEGVYLRWTLPEALRHSAADSPNSQYPLVPNRWLIIRLNGTDERQASAWVLESDCPYTSAVTTSDSACSSMYLADPELITAWKASADPIRQATPLNPGSSGVQIAKIGVSFPLAQWSERAAQPMFLSSVAPANPLFSGYLEHSLGVFSFYDPLTDIDDDTLSYSVVGWYSDPSQDILAPAGTDDTAYAGLLRQLGWAPAGGSDAATDRSVYHGATFSVGWNRTGGAPVDDPLQAIRDSGKVNVGVGNTTIDALTALLSGQTDAPAQLQLLRAFQYDLLQQLNEANGEALLDERIRRAWFTSTPGGYSWTIVDDSSDGGTTTDLTAAEQQWLGQLNQCQAQLDAALTTLYSLQWQLHALWLKKGYLSNADNTTPRPPGGVGNAGQFKGELADQLDPGRSGSVAAQLVAQFATVQQLIPQVPQPDWTSTDNAQQAWQNGIDAFATGRTLDSAKTLKATAEPRYWQAGNPVVLLSGVPATTSSAAGPDTLPVRPGDDLVTGLVLSDDTTVDADKVAGLLGLADLLGSLAAVPTGAAQPLFQEFLLLDPGNAAAIATATGQSQTDVTAVMTAHDAASYTGSLPALPLTGWQQPWTPMFLEWSGSYSPVPFTDGDIQPWTFDGTDYRLTAKVSPPGNQPAVGGISLLSPHASFVFGSRLDTFVQQYGTDTELARIDEWIASVSDWQFLAQELTGFHQTLALRDGRAFRRPTAADQLPGGYPVAALTGYGDGTVPAALALPPACQGKVNTVPLLPDGVPVPFQSARQGDFYFTDFFLYDAFGRVLYVIESGQSSGPSDYRNFPVLMDPALAPDQVMYRNIASVLQLPPRLLQPARLDIRLLDALDDTKVYGQDPDVVPISGWMLPNHLDGSIQLFAPDGTALGEFGLYVQEDGSKLGRWSAPPDSGLTLADVATTAPHLHDMLTSPQLAAEAGFEAFLAVIDETLWTTDPLGNRADANLSVLVGRPLALLRTRLQFQLDGTPITDTGWAATFTQPAPDFLTYDFSIRLGDQATRQDGVIGYFAASDGAADSITTDYGVFNSTVAPPAAPTQDYVSVVGPVGGTTPGNYLQLSFSSQSYQYLTVLADPRAAMHAYTGILPVKQCDIPQQFVDGALASMDVAFRLGPLLTAVGPSPNQGGSTPAHPQSIACPVPVEQNGSWSWWEPDATSSTWTGYGLVKASLTATSGPTPATLREGCLLFTTDLDSQAPADQRADPPRSP